MKSQIQPDPGVRHGRGTVRILGRRLRFARSTALITLPFMAAGAALMFFPWHCAPIAGAACWGLGLVVFFAAAYYWGGVGESIAAELPSQQK